MTTTQTTEVWPLQLNVSKDKDQLTVAFNTEETFVLSAEYLRISSPSAKTQGHSEADRVLEFGKKDVVITDVEPVGNYAVRIVFSDMHDTGFYSWTYLYELGTNQEPRWDKYLAELDAAGLTREG